MRIKRLIDPTLWGNIAAEAWLRRPPHYADALPLSWSLDGVEGLTVRWPERMASEGDARWLAFVRRGIAQHARLERTHIEQPYRGLVLLGVESAARHSNVVIDYADKVDLNPDALGKADLYFKMQHRREGYGDERVVPGGFPPNQSSLLAMLGALRGTRDRGEQRHDVSGRFSVDYASDVRTRAVSQLTEQSQFVFSGGLRHVRYSAFLREVARSSVCVDLPGNGPFCFRLVDYLAVGSCIVASPHEASMHVPLVDREHLVYTQPDLSDLIELCASLLADPRERERLATNARDYFDRYLTPRQIGAYYLRRCVEALVRT